MPKFLCVKGIIFFSFWQGFGISILVAIGLLRSTQYSTETLSLAIQDTLICHEMPLFALLHLYAFSHKDFIDQDISYCGRLPFGYAFKDCIFGFKDVLEDSLVTFKGTGFSYKTFEPSEGAIHHPGLVRERRVRAGLRYADGGKRKYWLPMPGDNDEGAHGRKPDGGAGQESQPSLWKKIGERLNPGSENRRIEAGYAPLLPEQAAEVIHEEGESEAEAQRQRLTDDLMPNVGKWDLGYHGPTNPGSDSDNSELDQVGFGGPTDEEELLYRDARRLEFGDYNNPVVDASKEDARRKMREAEDGIMASHPAAPPRVRKKAKTKSQTGVDPPPKSKNSLLHDDERVDDLPEQKEERPSSNFSVSRLIGSKKEQKREERLPEGCIDLLVEDKEQMEVRARRERLKGEANVWVGASPSKVYKIVNPEINQRSIEEKCKDDEENNNKNIKVKKGNDQVELIEDDQVLQSERVPGPSSNNLIGRGKREEQEEEEEEDRWKECDKSDDVTRNLSVRHASLSSSVVRNPWD